MLDQYPLGYKLIAGVIFLVAMWALYLDIQDYRNKTGVWAEK